jgi:hypothetical protein
LDISIWSTEWVKQWMLHVPRSSEVIVEVEKGAEDGVFYFVSESYSNVFINPSNDILDKYADDNKEKIIIKNLITDAPLQKIDNIQIPSIEKIIVDLILDDELFSHYQGRDLSNIIEQAYQYNTINEDRLYRYAQRRGKRDFVKNLIDQEL